MSDEIIPLMVKDYIKEFIAEKCAFGFSNTLFILERHEDHFTLEYNRKKLPNILKSTDDIFKLIEDILNHE